MKKRAFTILILLLLCLSSVALVGTIQTMSVYVKRENDVIKAYYTPLAMSDNAQGRIVALDSTVTTVDNGGNTTTYTYTYTGMLSVIIYNYSGENITGRDITFTVREPINSASGEYCNAAGDIIVADDTNTPHYVKDVFSVPMLLKNDTYLYDVKVVGETDQNPVAHTIDAVKDSNGDAAANSVTLQLKITKVLTQTVATNSTATAPDFGVDDVSIVLHLSEPYTDKYIINIKAADKLIVYSAVDMTNMEFDGKRVYMQTKDVLNYYSTCTVADGVMTGTGNTTYMGFKLQFEWVGYSIDLSKLEQYNHMRYSYSVNVVLDEDDNTVQLHKLTLYVPASSDFYFDFYRQNYDFVSRITMQRYLLVTMELYDNTLVFDTELQSGTLYSGGNLLIYHGYDGEQSFVSSPTDNIHSGTNRYYVFDELT
ncbi:MAG: hypothetical protein PHX51_06475 [Clostridia bacterium]|nr:hypothetical protein [Clostridia bacterium]